MKKFNCLKLFVVIFLLSLLSCQGENDKPCDPGDKRCTGDNLELCTLYSDWQLLEECWVTGGVCVTEGKDSFCEGSTETSDSFYEWPDDHEQEEEEEETSDGPPNPFGDLDFPDEDHDEDYYPDEEMDEYYDEENDDDWEEEDSDIEPVCGNGVLEDGEVCEVGDLSDCTEIDPDIYSGGKAFCLDDCSGYNTLTCDEIEH